MIKKFIEQNKCISFFFLISFITNVVYIVSHNWSEWFKGAGLLFNLFQQISVGYIVSCIFYYMQVFLPEYKKRHLLNQKISNKIRQYITCYLELIKCICEMHTENFTDNKTITQYIEYSKQFKDINLNEDTKRIDVKYFNAKPQIYIKLIDQVRDSFLGAERTMDKLMMWYGSDVSTEIVMKKDEIQSLCVVRILTESANNNGSIRLGSQPSQTLFRQLIEKLIELEEIYTKEYIH